jgi:hypothetical protein
LTEQDKLELMKPAPRGLFPHQRFA